MTTPLPAGYEMLTGEGIIEEGDLFLHVTSATSEHWAKSVRVGEERDPDHFYARKVTTTMTDDQTNGLDLNKLLDEHAKLREGMPDMPWGLSPQNEAKGGQLPANALRLAVWAVNNIGPLLEQAVIQEAYAAELEQKPESQLMKENVAMKKFVMKMVDNVKRYNGDALKRAMNADLDECAIECGAVPRETVAKPEIKIEPQICPRCTGRGLISPYPGSAIEISCPACQGFHYSPPDAGMRIMGDSRTYAYDGMAIREVKEQHERAMVENDRARAEELMQKVAMLEAAAQTEKERSGAMRVPPEEIGAQLRAKIAKIIDDNAKKNRGG